LETRWDFAGLVMYTDRSRMVAAPDSGRPAVSGFHFHLCFMRRTWERNNGTETREKECQFGIFTGETFMHGIGLAS
jgi:hypothetical protein